MALLLIRAKTALSLWEWVLGEHCPKEAATQTKGLPQPLSFTKGDEPQLNREQTVHGMEVEPPNKTPGHGQESCFPGIYSNVDKTFTERGKYGK